MSRSTRIALAISTLSTVFLAAPAYPQSQAGAPMNVKWSTSGADATSRPGPAGAPPSAASLGAPRGDLRRDVSEASRTPPPRRGD